MEISADNPIKLDEKDRSLSEKIEFRASLTSSPAEEIIPKIHVKEFIKLLKEELVKNHMYQNRTRDRVNLIKKIDKLAGPELT